MAAYAGMLPAGVQQVMHRLIGAPAAIVKAPSPTPGRRAGGPTQRATRTSGQGSRKTPSGDPTVSLARAVGPTGNPDAAGRGGTPNSHATSKNPHPTRDATPDSVTHDSATHDSATHDSANPAHPTKHVVTTSTTHAGGPGAKDNPTATRHSTGASGSTTLTPHS